MQDQTKLTQNGQELQLSDFNNVSAAASHADDAALSEVLRLAPYDGSNVARAILPYGYYGVDATPGTVSNGGATIIGAVCVNPFRAVVGARSSTPSLKFTDIRSAVFVNTTGTGTDTTLAIAAQAAGVGTIRLDLVYATIHVDQDGATVARYKKDATTKVITAISGPVITKTYVTVSIVTGTASVTPTPAALPADPVDGYNIPLAYLRVDNGFSAASVLPNSKIFDVSPVPAAAKPANRLTATPFFDGKTKSKFYMPPSMQGKVERWFVVDTAAGVIPTGTIIDNSIDWRKRLIRGDVQIAVGATETSWHAYATGNLPFTSTPTRFVSNSFDNGAADFQVVSFSGGLLSAGTSLSLFVDAGTGALYLDVIGSPSVTCFFWLDATGQFANK